MRQPQKIDLKVGRIAPHAPLGVLGGFIEHRVRQYVEPERKGVPKGESVGLSKKKFHAAALCSLTCLDLKHIAREVGCSYGLLLKWRTEAVFSETGTALVYEFLKGRFDLAAAASFELMGDNAVTVQVQRGVGVRAKDILKQQFIGLDDAALYSPRLIDALVDAWQEQSFKNLHEIGLASVWPFLSWVRVIDHLFRLGACSGRRDLKTWRCDAARLMAAWLTALLKKGQATKPKLLAAEHVALTLKGILRD